jgi:hypothetical protein
MKKFLTAVLMLILIGVIAGVAASLAARKRLEAMSDDEIRAFLADKLEGKVAEEQLATIQDATVAGIRKKVKGPVVDTDDAAVDEVEADVADADEPETEDADDIETLTT